SAPMGRVIAGATSSWAIDADGDVWAWGRDTDGSLGLGKPFGGSTTVPQELSADFGGKPVATVAPTTSVVHARTADGVVWAWGLTPFDNLGLGIQGDEGPVVVEDVRPPATLPSTWAEALQNTND
ncbi:MAG: hypothetical protein RI554_04940, partial [Trueperaceae bacterium]|nr:hypothetical protein [Trueperaceae bacterium]